jgi:hypothetical protein
MPTLLGAPEYLLEMSQRNPSLTRGSTADGCDPILNVSRANLMDSPAVELGHCPKRLNGTRVGGISDPQLIALKPSIEEVGEEDTGAASYSDPSCAWRSTSTLKRSASAFRVNVRPRCPRPSRIDPVEAHTEYRRELVSREQTLGFRLR